MTFFYLDTSAWVKRYFSVGYARRHSDPDRLRPRVASGCTIDRNHHRGPRNGDAALTDVPYPKMTK
jgi:hypothetical protein